MRYPPYSETNIKRLSMLLKETNFPSFKVLSYIFAFGLGVASVFVGQAIVKVSFPFRVYIFASVFSLYFQGFAQAEGYDALFVKVLFCKRKSKPYI